MLQPYFIVALLEAVILLPALVYICWRRPYRRRMILGYFTPHSIADYFDQFWSGDDHHSELAARYRKALKAQKNGADNDAEISEAEAALNAGLRTLYDKRFGWTAYMAPLVVLALILFFEANLVADFLDYWLAETAKEVAPGAGSVDIPAFSQLPDLVTIAALAGAYLWMGFDLISRVSALSLLPSDLAQYSLRMTIAPMLGFALTKVIDKPTASVFVAFAITFLPIADVFVWLRALATRSLGVADVQQSTVDKLVNLPGVDSDLAGRLQEQGITTIRQLADSDPVQLSMRTGLDFAFVVTLVDESLAWTYLGDRLPLLKLYGWSGAADIIDTVGPSKVPQSGPVEEAAIAYAQAQDDFQRADAAVKQASSATPDLLIKQTNARQSLEAARQALVAAASEIPASALLKDIAAAQDKLHLTEAGVRNIVLRITGDGYARFIHGLMRDIQTQPAPPPAPPSIGSAFATLAAGVLKLFAGKPTVPPAPRSAAAKPAAPPPAPEHKVEKIDAAPPPAPSAAKPDTAPADAPPED